MQQQDCFIEFYYSDDQTRPITSREEEYDLIVRAQAGDEEAREELIRRNVRFVVTVAQQFYSPDGVFSLADLVSDGNIGLIEAIDRFDPHRGFKFISYAVWWIRQSIHYSINQNISTVRRPSNHWQMRRDLDRHTEKLTQELGRRPTPEEIADASGLSLKRVKDTINIRLTDVSLDTPLKSDDYEEDKTYGSAILIDHTEADELVKQLELHLALSECLEILDERERRIIKAYFGLEGEQPLSLARLGEVIGVTRERVRQVRNVALDKMKAHLIAQHRQAANLLPPTTEHGS